MSNTVRLVFEFTTVCDEFDKASGCGTAGVGVSCYLDQEGAKRGEPALAMALCALHHREELVRVIQQNFMKDADALGWETEVTSTPWHPVSGMH